MPQLPNSSTEDLGADDEVKEYKQEDGEDSENGTHLDLVNDIKSDLIKKETENSEVSRPFYNFIRKPSRFKASLIFFMQVGRLPFCFALRCRCKQLWFVGSGDSCKRRPQSLEHRIILFRKIVNKLLFLTERNTPS